MLIGKYFFEVTFLIFGRRPRIGEKGTRNMGNQSTFLEDFSLSLGNLVL